MDLETVAKVYLKNTSRWTSSAFLLSFLHECKLDVGKVDEYDVTSKIIDLGAGTGMVLDEVMRYVKRDLEELKKKGRPPSMSEEFG